MVQKVKTFLSKGNRAAWCLFLLFAISIFLKGVIFHWFCFHSVILSSLWHHPLEFIRFWGGKLIPALFLGGFVFLFRSKTWMIYAHVLIDIWLIANLFYYNANALFLSYETMKMADNMSGFWDSLYAYTEWSMLLYPIITLLFAVCLLCIPKVSKRLPIAFCVVMSLSLLLSIIDNLCFKVYTHSWHPQNKVTEQVNSRMLSGEEFTYYYPFGHVYYFAVVSKSIDYNAWAYSYVREYSVLSYFPACFVWSILRPAGEIIDLTEKDIEQVRPFIHGNIRQKTPTPQTNLVFVLFESLESWPIDEVCGYNFMPNLQAISRNKHSLYCNKLKSQVRHGNSADGQLIDITGLLPIANGATCRLYADNILPSYAQCYPYSAIINPAPGMWNQEKVTFGYQFKQLIEPQKGEHWADKELIDQMINYIDTVKEPFCLFGISVSSHVPFSQGSINPTYIIDGMPHIMLAYLNCLHYTDSVIGNLVNAVQCNERLANNTTIVISGDHTIFRGEDQEIDTFADIHDINMQTTHTYTPLIIYSPKKIKNNIYVTDTCYQMDIYPTIMDIIGCEEYFWKGVGVNVMDSAARNNRPILEKDAYDISDMIIRSNYFNLH
jgi:phosphoglycerol transferase MdoB-like AlkP superfamily enzyme